VRQETNELLKGKLTVLVPAYNEAGSITDTVKSLQEQTVPIHEIIVIDDVSSDETSAVARALGVKVLRPPKNTGSKAGAQNYALAFVTTEYTLAIDADTTLATDGVERLMTAFIDPGVVAASGFVLPRHVKTIWERGRYVEYLFAFTFYKQIQDYYSKPMISSGCFSMYRTDVLKENGGWQTRTLAEDMDLTWSYYAKGYRVKFIPEALCYPIEPHDFNFMRKQLKRWSHGFVQNVNIHWKEIRRIKFLNLMVTVAMWDAVVASFFYLLLLPVVSLIFLNPFFLVGYVIDIPAVLVPTLYAALQRKEVLRLLACFFCIADGQQCDHVRGYLD
jgi:cellulose synthase/poly-beta-1,6-N-acetylglucosamine synthase-like glycosyltransferase